MHYVPAPLALRGFNPGFISSLTRNPGFQRLRRRSFFTQNQVPDSHAPVISVSLSFDGFNPGFRLVRARRLRRRIYCLARSESCASVRSLGILGFSGCVGGFFMPKNGYQLGTRHMHCVPAPLVTRPKTAAQATTNVLSVTFSIQGLHASQKRSKVLFVAYAMRRKHSWRIRLAAYGARLERVLG